MMCTEAELIHDLRMPLQLIQSSAQMIRLSLDDAASDANRYVDMLLESVGQMRRMLDGAMADCGARPSQRPAPLDVVACVRELAGRCRPWAEGRGVTLACSGNVDALVLAADADGLSRILLNLIANAVKAASPGGRVRVCWTALGDRVEIAVADDGHGIPPERLPWVFLAGETDGGHGYGLPSACACARAMGGDITACSEPGRGSAFTLRLPVRGAEVS